MVVKSQERAAVEIAGMVRSDTARVGPRQAVPLVHRCLVYCNLQR
jgi:hypothetical protein